MSELIHPASASGNIFVSRYELSNRRLSLLSETYLLEAHGVLIHGLLLCQCRRKSGGSVQPNSLAALDHCFVGSWSRFAVLIETSHEHRNNHRAERGRLTIVRTSVWRRGAQADCRSPRRGMPATSLSRRPEIGDVRRSRSTDQSALPSATFW